MPAFRVVGVSNLITAAEISRAIKSAYGEPIYSIYLPKEQAYKFAYQTEIDMSLLSKKRLEIEKDDNPPK
jgi:hypothetical protein